MDYHKNAPWATVSRERLARLVIDDGVRVDSAAARFGLSPKTAAKWVARYRQFGVAGLADRSSRPHHSPRQIDSFPPFRKERERMGHGWSWGEEVLA